MTAPCTHGSADPRLCVECRRERVGRPMPGYFATELADAVAPGRVIELGDVDHALRLSQDLQLILGRIRYVALPWEDVAALYRAATRHRLPGRLAADVSVRVATALAEAYAADPSLRPEAANAIPPGDTGSDHGDNSTGVDPERPP